MALYDVSTSEKKTNPELVSGGTLYASAPIGTIFATMSALAPSGFLMCDGTAYSATDYPELWAILPSTVKDTTNNTFTIDLRESTLKGAGLTGHTVGNHLDADGLAVGEFLDDQLQVHTHSNKTGATTAGQVAWTMFATNQVGTATEQTNNGVVGRFGATTEVKSVGVNYIIKAKMIGVPSDFLAKVDEAVEESIAPRTIYCAALIENTDLSEARTVTANRNGFFIVNIEKSSGTAGNTVRLKVNNKYAQWVPFWGTNYGTTLCAFVRNGDEIEISADGAGSEFKIASAIIQEISWT